MAKTHERETAKAPAKKPAKGSAVGARSGKKPANRAKTGQGGDTRFKPGQSGNPDGRPKIPPELREAARAAAPEALQVLVGIMLNIASREADRIRAAELVLNRAYGTPPASVEVTTPSGIPAMTPDERAVRLAAILAKVLE